MIWSLRGDTARVAQVAVIAEMALATNPPRA
jgi:hypothetical protein